MTPLSSMPKIELHLHLEGAAPPALVRQMAAHQGADMSGLFDERGAYCSTDFTSFLRAYDRVSGFFDTPEAYLHLTEAVLAEAASHGVIYAEIFLSPTSFGYDFGRWGDLLAGVEAGADRAEAKSGILCRLIPVAIRHHDPALGSDLADLVTRLPKGRIVGFGLAGDERMGAPRDWAPAFARAREAGLRLTAHAGEFGGPESVSAVLDDLGVERIGHGVRAHESPSLVRRLAEEGRVLEVCPGSNVALGLYPDLAKHPIRKLFEAGCMITVSTDDPPFFHTDMSQEYASLAAVHGFGVAEFRRMGEAALQGAFCDESTRRKLAGDLADALARGL